EVNDVVYRQSRFCYEQSLPAEVTDPARGQAMLEDLNEVFGRHIGVTGDIIDEWRDSYLLEGVPGGERPVGLVPAAEPDRSVCGDSVTYEGYAMRDVVISSLSDIVNVSGLERPLVFDHSTGKEKYTITLPQWKEGDTVAALDKVL